MSSSSVPVIDVKKLIAYYIRVIIDGDLKKLDQIALESEDKFRRKVKDDSLPSRVEVTRPVQAITSAAITTTVRPPVHHQTDFSSDPAFHYLFDSDTARCAVPMGMTLFCLAEFVGSLLVDPYRWDPKMNLRSFFNESGLSLDDAELDLLRINFRNGIMHAYFPKGEEIGIVYDSYADLSKIFLNSGSAITLNVKALLVVVSSTLRRLFWDISKHEIMRKSYEGYLSDRRESYDSALLNYRTSRLSPT